MWWPPDSHVMTTWYLDMSCDDHVIMHHRWLLHSTESLLQGESHCYVSPVCHKADNCAFSPGADPSCATTSVDIVLDWVREIKVHNEVHFWEVKASRYCICTHHHTRSPITELLQSALSVLRRDLSMELQTVNPVFGEVMIAPVTTGNAITEH
jgi:hypothetical protein